MNEMERYALLNVMKLTDSHSGTFHCVAKWARQQGKFNNAVMLSLIGIFALNIINELDKKKLQKRIEELEKLKGE